MGEIRRLKPPASEVCSKLGVVGLTVYGELLGPSAVQLYDQDMQPVSSPITPDEAGWGVVGSDYYLTEWDEKGRASARPNRS